MQITKGRLPNTTLIMQKLYKIVGAGAIIIALALILNQTISRKNTASQEKLAASVSSTAQGGPKGVADTFLKFGDIQGEAKGSGPSSHRDEILLEAFDWSISRANAQGPVQAGKLKLTKRVDKASPQLMLLAANGQHTPEAIISVRKQGTGTVEDLLQLKLTDVVVTFYAVGKNSDTLPTEDMEISFTKVESIYRELRQNGSYGPPIRNGWDFVQNSAF